MKKSISKIRHIQKANLLLENRFFKKNLLNEVRSTEDLLSPVEEPKEEYYLQVLKDSGINDLQTFKKNCLNNSNCGFSNKEKKELEPNISDFWDGLSSECWECYGLEVTSVARTNYLYMEKMEKLKPFCTSFQTSEDDPSSEYNEKSHLCDIRLSENSYIKITYQYMGGLINPSINFSIYDNDLNNQQLISGQLKTFLEKYSKPLEGRIVHSIFKTSKFDMNNLETFVNLFNTNK
jgi:hypothetical protein